MSWWRIMRSEPLAVRTAAPVDRAGVATLLATSWRRHGNEALEDQAALLANGLSQVATVGDTVVGFLGLAARQPTGTPPQTWVDVAMMAVEDERSADQMLKSLLAPAIAGFRQGQATGLVCLTAAEWLREALARAGFAEVDQVISYVHAGRTVPPAGGTAAELRPATTGDADTLLALNAAAFAPLWRYEDATVLSWLMTAEHPVLAFLHERPIGFALTTAAVANGYAHLTRVATHPSVQGQGIGRQLVADALRYAHSVGAPGLALNTQASNAVARHLYESFGFQRTGHFLSVLVYRL